MDRKREIAAPSLDDERDAARDEQSLRTQGAEDPEDDREAARQAQSTDADDDFDDADGSRLAPRSEDD